MGDAEPPEDVAKTELWNRLRRLEKSVFSSRRDILKTGAAAAAGGALTLGAGSGSADPGDDGDTTWGSDSNRDDYWVDELDARSVSTADINNTKNAGEYDGDYGGIASAISDAGTNGKVYVPPGNYTASNTGTGKSVPSGVTVVGYGATLTAAGGEDYNRLFNLADTDDATFVGMKIDGNKSGQSGGNGYGFNPAGPNPSSGCKWIDCKLLNFLRGVSGASQVTTLNVDGENNTMTFDLTSRSLVLGGHHEACQDAVRLRGANSAAIGTTAANGTSGYDFFIDGADGSAFVRCTSINNQFDAIHIDDCEGSAAIGCTVEGSGDVGIVVFNPNGTTRFNRIANCTARGCAITGIRSVGSGPSIITGNSSLNNGSDTSALDWRRTGIEIQSPGSQVVGNICTDTQGTKTQLYGVTASNGTSDVHMAHNYLDGNANGRWTNQSGRNDRFVADGWSVNSGDPSASGAWNGEGYEGLMVRDTTNGNNYVYADGGWFSL